MTPSPLTSPCRLYRCCCHCGSDCCRLRPCLCLCLRPRPLHVRHRTCLHICPCVRRRLRFIFVLVVFLLICFLVLFYVCVVDVITTYIAVIPVANVIFILDELYSQPGSVYGHVSHHRHPYIPLNHSSECRTGLWLKPYSPNKGSRRA